MNAPTPDRFSPRPRRSWFSFSLRSLLIVTTLFCIGIVAKQQYDWRRKRTLIHQWIEPLVDQARAADGDIVRYVPPDAVRFNKPADLTPEEEVAILMFGILESKTPEERFAALAMLVESRRADAAPVLRELLPQSQRHPELQTVLLHLLAFARDPEDLAQLEPYLEHRLPEIRAAAAESIGYIRAPAYDDDGTFSNLLARTNTLPPISAVMLHPVNYARPTYDQVVLRQTKDTWPASVRERIEAMMLRGQTELERTAAARALVSWPPEKYSLRVAEWGVWLDSNGKLEMAKSVLAENPPFVHGTGNPLASLPRNRLTGPLIMVVTKPIVHLTADRPLAVDLEVEITHGRPWYAFPRPDAFTVHIHNQSNWRVGIGEPTIPMEWLKLDPTGLSELDDLSEGYPWLHPQDRSSGARYAEFVPDAPITAVGLRWQSLIVSPERTVWQIPTDVPEDARFQWWQALRDVPSSWITSQNETERFLYYDGPNSARPPVIAELVEGRLQLSGQIPLFIEGYGEEDERFATTVKRHLLFVDTTATPPRACALRPEMASGDTISLALDEQTWLTGEGIEEYFRNLVHQRGLTPEEAEGLIFAWRERFFHNPGRRLISLLTPEEYDRLCPLKIRPAATKTVRVGIVLTEF